MTLESRQSTRWINGTLVQKLPGALLWGLVCVWILPSASLAQSDPVGENRGLTVPSIQRTRIESAELASVRSDEPASSADEYRFLEELRVVSLDPVAQRAVVRTASRPMAVVTPGEAIDKEGQIVVSRVLADRVVVRAQGTNAPDDVEAWVFRVGPGDSWSRYQVLETEPPPGRLIRVPHPAQAEGPLRAIDSTPPVLEKFLDPFLLSPTGRFEKAPQ